MLEPMLDPRLLFPERVRPLMRREYQALVDTGAFENERVELLHGMLVEMSPQGEPHARITAWLAHAIGTVLSIDAYDVRSPSPFAATDDSMPEPDVSVSRRTARGPHSGSTELLIEVAGSSLTKDRDIKTEIYAEAGVPEYWIVDLRSSTVDVLTGPTRTGYTTTTRHAIGDVLRPHRLRAVRIDVAAIPWEPISEA